MEALCSGDPRLVFAGYALSWLTHLSEASIALYYGVDRRLAKYDEVVVVANGSGTPTPQVTASLARYRQRFDALDPFAPRRYSAGSVTVVDSADLGPAYALAAAPYFADYLHALGMRRQTTFHLRREGRIVAGLDLLRPDDDRGREKQVLRMLRSAHAMIEYAHNCAYAGTPPTARIAPIEVGNLTRRQREIALLVARGASNGEVARALSISESTVKTHLMRIYEKLNVRSRTQLAVALSGAA